MFRVFVLLTDVAFGGGRVRGTGSGEGSGVRLPLDGDGLGEDRRGRLLGYMSAADSDVLDEDGWFGGGEDVRAG